MGLKLIYKRSLAMALVRRGFDIEYTSRNRKNQRYQVYFFHDSPELRKNLAELSGKEYVPEN
ncbi:hypothetical protein [Alkalihalobacillus sp. R86527]|uniref:hypothetical protein n=1 Tax=Alkalihalobacillus sp. R86527 TaxID=3093863 RepID=UPI00366B1130